VFVGKLHIRTSRIKFKQQKFSRKRCAVAEF